MNPIIPMDIIDIIYTYNKLDFARLTKQYFKEHTEYEASKKICKWWSLISNTRSIMENWSKQRYLNYLEKYYEWKHLKKYPTFLTKKCGLPECLRQLAREVEETQCKESIVLFFENPIIMNYHFAEAGF
jgi:hypothetical protein